MAIRTNVTIPFKIPFFDGLEFPLCILIFLIGSVSLWRNSPIFVLVIFVVFLFSSVLVGDMSQDLFMIS